MAFEPNEELPATMLAGEWNQLLSLANEGMCRIMARLSADTQTGAQTILQAQAQLQSVLMKLQMQLQTQDKTEKSEGLKVVEAD